MTDAPRGAFYTGRGEIVGPADQSIKLAEAINDPELHVTFVGGESAQIYTRAAMAMVDVEYPVLKLPTSAEAQWTADREAGVPGAQQPMHDGPLPDIPNGPSSTFDIISPKGK